MDRQGCDVVHLPLYGIFRTTLQTTMPIREKETMSYDSSETSTYFRGMFT